MKRRQNLEGIFVIRQWKRFVLQMGIGLCICSSAKPIDGFAAPPMDDRFQRVEQREDMPKILPDAGKSTGWEMEPEADGWEEEFTDTDSRRGILAVRGEVFQGFGGQVQLVVKEVEGGRETVISLHREGGYIANQELQPGRYQVVFVEADSDGRKFDSHVEAEELVVDTDRVTMCQFFVNPGSVYQVPHEETETEEGEIADEAQGKKQEENISDKYGKNAGLSVSDPKENSKTRTLFPGIMAAAGISIGFGKLILSRRKNR